MTVQPITISPADEYFRRDQQSPEKLEYYAGMIWDLCCVG